MDLAFLSTAIDRPGPWATVWADASFGTADAAHQQELTSRGIRERLAAQGADRATREALYEAMTSPAPGAPGSRAGRYLLGTGGEVVCDLALAGPPARSGEAWSALPRLSPLLDGLAAEEPCLVAYIDRTGADLERRNGSGVRALGGRQGEGFPVHRTGRDVWSERHHRLKVENTWERNAETIARFIEDAWQDAGADFLLLAGDARERHSVRDRLPADIAGHTAETEHGGRAKGAETALLDRDVAAARAAFEHDRTRRDLDRLNAGATEAVRELPALAEAAREHRIDTLFVHPRSGGTAREVWAGAQADQVAVRREELLSLGEAAPRQARADDALLRSCVMTGAGVCVVPDPGQAPPGGLAALLRWS